MRDREPYRTLAGVTMRDVMGTMLWAITGVQLYMFIRAQGAQLGRLPELGSSSAQARRPARGYTPHEPLGGTFSDELLELDQRTSWIL